VLREIPLRNFTLPLIEVPRTRNLARKLKIGIYYGVFSFLARFLVRGTSINGSVKFRRGISRSTGEELIGGFLTYRLSRQHGRKRPQNHQNGDDLIPSLGYFPKHWRSSVLDRLHFDGFEGVFAHADDSSGK
jgi:hypothetical protein